MSTPSSSASTTSDPTPEPHQHPPRRRLVKSSSLNKRDPGAAAATSPKSPAAVGRVNKGVDEHSNVNPIGARRPPLNPPPQDARPLGRQGSRSLTPGANKQQGDESLRMIQQSKRNALARASVATGSFKSFDSPFGNYLLPVVPVHLLSKPAPLPK